jgi:hypothetical protein
MPAARLPAVPPAVFYVGGRMMSRAGLQDRTRQDDGIRAHSTPDPSTPDPTNPDSPSPSPDPDDIPAPARAPVQEPDAPTPPVKAAPASFR